jgi:hypothetical protein
LGSASKLLSFITVKVKVVYSKNYRWTKLLRQIPVLLIAASNHHFKVKGYSKVKPLVEEILVQSL